MQIYLSLNSPNYTFKWLLLVPVPPKTAITVIQQPVYAHTAPTLQSRELNSGSYAKGLVRDHNILIDQGDCP